MLLLGLLLVSCCHLPPFPVGPSASFQAWGRPSLCCGSAPGLSTVLFFISTRVGCSGSQEFTSWYPQNKVLGFCLVNAAGKDFLCSSLYVSTLIFFLFWHEGYTKCTFRKKTEMKRPNAFLLLLENLTYRCSRCKGSRLHENGIGYHSLKTFQKGAGAWLAAECL